MSKKTKLFRDLNNQFDEKAYLELERSQPQIANTVRQLVDSGVEPSEIKHHIMMRFANRWLEAQTLEQAARHCEYVKEMS